ncbi:MAG: pseudouridine synthase [Peptoclostridium sp.]|uniref:pseudouridine synthase n=1 Tax=Peptoclostridium sp. TaxID=1904860 RepID=UPI00139B41C7|nr:pseudouridine synthase [Peptoclostridium sp.]MZQ75812.1 pseudouridine synthase [Peptoclostridium sp.]
MAKGMRLDKLLSNLGYGSRKDIKLALKSRIVKVNGELEKDPARHVDPEKDVVEYNGERIEYREFIYLMLNKPDGYVSATFDNRDKTVLDLIDGEYLVFEPFPVGRLDKDTEGLLVLTNDGALAHRVLSPKKHVKKRYFALVEGEVTSDDIEAFSEGVELEDGYKTLPSQLEILESGETSRIELTIYEGKFHQVKRMFEAVGKKVTYLKRLSMGNLRLDESLGLGEYRELTGEELLMLEEER